MYNSYWKLEGKPFTLLQKPELFVYSGAHEAVMLSLLHAIDHELGLSLLEGSSGAGKSFLTRILAARLRERGFQVALVGAVGLDRSGFLATALQSLEKHEDALSKGHFWSRLETLFAHWKAEGCRGFLLIVDPVDGQVDAGVWGAMQQFLDFDASQELPVHLLLVGRPGLEDAVHEGSSLDGRVGWHCRLADFSLEDTTQYLRDRLMRAGGSRDLFSRGAVEALHRHSEGVPLRINLLADRSLLIAAQRDLTTVDSESVDASLGAGIEMPVSKEWAQESNDLLDIHRELLKGSSRILPKSEVRTVDGDSPEISSGRDVSSDGVAERVPVTDVTEESREDSVDTPSQPAVEVAPEVSEEEEQTILDTKEPEPEPTRAERSLDEILDGLLPEDSGTVSSGPAPSLVQEGAAVSKETSTWVSRDVPLPTLQVSEAGQRHREEEGARRTQSFDGVSRSESHDLRDCLDEEEPPAKGLGGVLDRLFGVAE